MNYLLEIKTLNIEKIDLPDCCKGKIIDFGMKSYKPKLLCSIRLLSKSTSLIIDQYSVKKNFYYLQFGNRWDYDFLVSENSLGTTSFKIYNPCDYDHLLTYSHRYFISDKSRLEIMLELIYHDDFMKVFGINDKRLPGLTKHRSKRLLPKEYIEYLNINEDHKNKIIEKFKNSINYEITKIWEDYLVYHFTRMNESMEFLDFYRMDNY